MARPMNSDKTTIFLPFDDLYGFKQVVHKPAVSSKFVLRNLREEEGSFFWDDDRPIEYTQDTHLLAAFYKPV